MCLYPKLIKNRKYLSNAKNGGHIPPITDDRIKYVPIGCQECIECRKQKARTWQARLLEEIKTNKNGKFITLTFSNESIKELTKDIKNAEGYELDNQIATLGVRRFLERWRKKYKKSVRHWMTTEIGHNGTENIHIHGIIWTDETKETIEKEWKYGYIWTGTYVNEATINYIIKYVSKMDINNIGYKSKILTSPGIGNQYTKKQDSKINKYNNKETVETYRTRTGHKINLPIYWRNKIYTETQREELWINRLDKQERWIMGERVNIKTGLEPYYKLLKWYQKKNIQLGYGNGYRSEEEETYIRQNRQLKIMQRIQNTKYKTPAASS